MPLHWTHFTDTTFQGSRELPEKQPFSFNNLAICCHSSRHGLIWDLRMALPYLLWIYCRTSLTLTGSPCFILLCFSIWIFISLKLSSMYVHPKSFGSWESKAIVYWLHHSLLIVISQGWDSQNKGTRLVTGISSKPLLCFLALSGQRPLQYNINNQHPFNTLHEMSIVPLQPSNKTPNTIWLKRNQILSINLFIE